LLQEWRQKRDDRYRRSRIRAEATEMIAFIEKWIATQKLACTDEEFGKVKQTAHQQLERIYSSVVDAEEKKRPMDEHSFFRRLLLLYRATSPGARVLHYIFYLLVVFDLMLVGFLAALIPALQKGPDAIPLPVAIVVVLILSMVLFVPALAIRAWAVALDKKNRKNLTKGISDAPMIQLQV